MVKGLNHLISAMSTYLLKTARILNEPLVAKSTNYSCPFSILTPHSLLHFNFFLKIVGLGCYQFVFLYSAFISYSNSAYRFFLISPLETLSSSGNQWNRHISYSICDVNSWMGGCYLRGRILGWKQHHVRDATPSFTFQPFLIYSETPIETD